MKKQIMLSILLLAFIMFIGYNLNWFYGTNTGLLTAIGVLIIITAVLIYIFGTKKHHLHAHDDHKSDKAYKKSKK